MLAEKSSFEAFHLGVDLLEELDRTYVHVLRKQQL